MSATNTNGDCAELEALFDSVAQQSTQTAAAPVAAAAPAAPPTAGAEGDSAELEALFDSVAQQQLPETKPAARAKPARKKGKALKTGQGAGVDEVMTQVGQMTRALHDSLRSLGYDKDLDRAATSIPDARERIAYVATLTQQAADKVLNAVDIAKPIQAALQQDASDFAQRWDGMFDGKLDVEAFKQLAQDTRAFMHDVPKRAAQADAQLTEIVMAQDFQDLTGQVLQKITVLVQQVESQLLKLLLDHVPGAALPEEEGALAGPVISANGNPNVVTSQAQVDDLLASLGF